MDFKISISIPQDNPQVAQVDHTGVEYPAIQISKQDKFIQILNQAKYQKEIEQIKLNEEKNATTTGDKDKEKEKEKQQLITQQKVNPMETFQFKMYNARVELEQLLNLIEHLKNKQISTIIVTEEYNENQPKPISKPINAVWDATHTIAHKKQSLQNVSQKLKLGATKMKETISTMSGWWNDVSTLRTKWRLKGKDTNQSGGTGGGGGNPNQQSSLKSNSKRLSIDYGYYTSGSFIEQTEADLSRGPNGEINIDFPNLPNQQSINKRLYINVKSSDSKTFYNHFSNIKKLTTTPFQFYMNSGGGNNNSNRVNTPKTPNSSASGFPSSSAFNKLRQQQQIQLQLQAQQAQAQQAENSDDPEEIHRKFILNCTNQLNKAQKYQFNNEIFEQLSREVASLNLSSGIGAGVGGNIGGAGGGANIGTPIGGFQSSPTIPPSIGAGGVISNLTGGIGNVIGNSGSLSLTTSTGGENIMLTEKEIRIECGNFNLFIGMDSKNKDDSPTSTKNTTNTTPTTTTTINCNSNKNVIYSDEERNRLLFVLKTILKKISVLQLKRSQKQLTMNLSRRTPKIVFGKKSIVGHNDEVIFKITSIVKHMDTYLRVYKVLEIFEQKLPIRLKSTPAAESASSLFILTLIDSCQNLKNPMVPIEISINQNKIEVVQGQNRSFSNKDEVILGSFIISLLKSYFITNNIHPSNLDIIGFNDDNEDDDDMVTTISTSSCKKYKFSNSSGKQGDKIQVQLESTLDNDNDMNIDDMTITNKQPNKYHLVIENFFKSLIEELSIKLN